LSLIGIQEIQLGFLNSQDTQWVVLNRNVFKKSKWVFP
jgi:hypothetical protein